MFRVELGPFRPGMEVSVEGDKGFPYVEHFVRYFRGERMDLAWIPVADERYTPFQRAVWQAVRGIPYGEVRTYGQMAKAISMPKAARAVGRALAVNPFPLVVPCHRVVGRDGSLTGFGAGLEWKRALLELEGCKF